MDAALSTASLNEAAAAPSAGPDADLFNAVLGQMMGQGEIAPESGTDTPAGRDAFTEDDADAPADIDPTELVNPMFLDGGAPVAPVTPVATLVWTIPAVPEAAPASPAVDVQAAVIDAFTAPDAPADVPVSAPVTAGPPPVFDMPIPSDAPSAAPGHTPAEESPAAPGPRVKALDIAAVSKADTKVDPTSDPKAARTADAPPAASPIDQLPAATTERTDRNARSEFAPQIADAINKQDRPVRGAKHEKAPVEPKLDAAGIRPMPFVAVERAYAGNEQSARSFDSPKEQSPLPGFPAASQAGHASGSAPAFVVPTDGRPMLNAPLAAAGLDTVDIPATMARDIDTHVPQQIVQSVRLQAINGGGEAVIRLNPDYLGEVVVAVKVEQGTVTASLQAETPAVRQWAERNESVLRQALAEQGLQLDKLTVSEKASETERDGAHEDTRDEAREEHSQQQPRRRRPQSDEATFEVTV